LFEAVQSRLAQQRVHRKIKSSKSPSFLAGLIFDDRGHAMSPSHASKKGVRYRYYVSQALLQNRKSEAGSVARISAPDVEQMVTRAARRAFPASEDTADRDLVVRGVQRIVVGANCVRISLHSPPADGEPTESDGATASTMIEVPFAPNLPLRKGIERTPATIACIDPREREALLEAIVRARVWMDAVMTGVTATFEDIAVSEGLGVRHVRRLAPLAFLSPKIVQVIADGTAPSGLTASFLTPALPLAWSAQEQMAGVR
jgi:site-specific DNA recombinase